MRSPVWARVLGFYLVYTLSSRFYLGKSVSIHDNSHEYLITDSIKENEDGSRPCDMDDFRYGHWERGASTCGLKTAYNISTSDWIDHQRVDYDKYKPWADYCWVPQYCQTKSFNAEDFCRRLNGQRVLFVGDSLLYAMYKALVYEVEGNSNPEPLPRTYLRYNKHVGGMCNGSVMVFFLTNDQLSVRGEPSVHTSGKWRGNAINADWKSALSYVDILVMNKGHHAKQVSERQFRESSDDTIRYLRHFQRNSANRRNTSFFFVTTSIGHPMCRESSEAILQPLTRENPNYDALNYAATRHNPNYKVYYDSYGWHLYAVHDAYLISQFRHQLHATIIDVAPASSLRPDGHRYPSDAEVALDVHAGDCLHYQAPGPVSSWVYIWYNLLP